MTKGGPKTKSKVRQALATETQSSSAALFAQALSSQATQAHSSRTNKGIPAHGGCF
jgi:hypothetical protein